MTKSTIITARARFFGRRIESRKVRVDDDAIRVLDDVAGYYTTCHSLGTAAQRRIRKIAAANH